MDTATGECFELNAVGAEIWTEIQNGHPLAHIVDGLAARYGIAREQVGDDTKQLVDQLVAHGMLRASTE